MHRRSFLVSGASMLMFASGGLSLDAWAQTPTPAAENETPRQFSFDLLTQMMRERATKDYEAPAENLPEKIASLNYDQHRAIRFLPDHGLWQGESPFELQAFHPGWLFKQPVKIHVVENGAETLAHFDSSMFEYRQPLKAEDFNGIELPGVAGFRLHYPLNDPAVMDELVSFLGASYFRALGRGSFYGISARGLAVNTATSEGEEFPRFSEFWIEKPTRQSKEINIYAALDSQSVTGAYHFKIVPGRNTVMEVTARLFTRSDIRRLGIAPMTSMFLYSENNRAAFDDYRNQVHDSDGLKIVRADGEEVWRHLNNPSELANSFYVETNPKAFGLFQRDRDFDHYQDSEAGYQRRPSLLVEPIGEWGKGSINLVELPTELEVNDNIVAFWIPEAEVKAGQELEYRYRLTWGSIEEPTDKMARVVALRSGAGGTSGVENAGNLRKFVVDFEGEIFGSLSPEDKVEAVINVGKAKIAHDSLSKVEANGVWRLVIDLAPDGDPPVEISGYLKVGDNRISEVWSYQWRRNDGQR